MRRIFEIVLAVVVCTSIPDVHGQVYPVPGTIQAEDYVAYQDSDAGNNGNSTYRDGDDVDIEYGAGAVNGNNVGWIATGEWLDFTVNVSTSATYEVRYRVASQNGGPFSIQMSVDGQPADLVTFNGTGSWTGWSNEFSPTPFTLASGTHTVRLDFLSSDFNIDEFEFTLAGPTGPVDTNVPPYLISTNPVSMRVDDLMSRMSLDEKIGQMTQAEKGSVTPAGVAASYMGSVLSGGGGGPFDNATPADWANMIDAYQVQALTTPLQIPILYGIDAVHGHNNVVGATIFPHNIGLGATRNPDLMEQMAQVTASEVAATGAHWTFAPTMAVARNEAWGRTYESLSEVPELVTELSAAAIRGYQGTHLLASSNILATAKHFAGDGGTANGVDQGNTILDEATFRELHVAPYIDAIAAGAKTVMVSYSSWNGEKMHGHKYMLTDVLKGELGFDGFLISDWAGVDQVAGPYYDDVVQSINAGMDMVMVPYDYVNFINTLKSAVMANDVSMTRIDDAVRRILTVKFESGLFENPYSQQDLLADVGSAAHREVARQAVAESMVVLKDGPGLLPLSKNLTRIHVAGKSADNLGYQCGGWTISWQGGSGATTVGTTILQGIEDTVSPGTTVTYSLNGSGAAGADVGIVVVGETPYAEGAGDSSNLFLSSADLSAINTVRAAGIPVIVILVSGRPMFVESELSNWDALIAAWLPGTEGQGVADVLFGDTFPVGILSHSWPRNNAIPVNLGDAGYNPLFPYGYSVYVNGDIDNDSLTDRWEAMHGLDPYDDGTVNPDFGSNGNPDGDVGDNLYEFNTGTHPQLAESIFRILDVQSIASSNSVHVTTFTVPGYEYGIDYADMLGTSVVWNAFVNPANGVGTWLETSSAETNFTFVDDFTSSTSGGAPSGSNRFYRVRSTAP
jgi:beta-glucosidase